MQPRFAEIASWVRGITRAALRAAARLARALALLLALDDVDDQADELLGAGGLGLAVGEGLDPVGDLAFLRHNVEELPPHLNLYAGVRGRTLGDLDLRHLEAEVLDVAAAAQLHSHDQLDRLERRDFTHEPAGRELDQRFGVLAHRPLSARPPLLPRSCAAGGA